MRAERFRTILWPSETPAPCDHATLHDLALDRVFEALADGAPGAAAALGAVLPTVADVQYRQGVFRGLEDSSLWDCVTAFLNRCQQCQRCDSAASHARYPYEAELWHLDGVVTYVEAVETFAGALKEILPGLGFEAKGWRLLADYLAEYVASPEFDSLSAQAAMLRGAVVDMRFNLLIRGAKVTVAQTDAEADLGEAVRNTFERFRQPDATDHRTSFRIPELDHVQAWILERVALIHPKIFTELRQFLKQTGVYHDPVLWRFIDEVRFYLVYLEYIAPMRAQELPLCYPQVGESEHDVVIDDGWDLALGSMLVDHGHRVVTNSIALASPERIVVISGPNQGGKTTTARSFGQVYLLAAMGCPVPGSSVRLALCDRVFTVFEREEELETLEGRMGAEVHRIHDMVAQATNRSVIILNEAFASTALHDARILTTDVLERICRLGAMAACVTFIDELSRLNEHTVSMVSTVDPADPTIRTFHVERRYADGHAYAEALAAKHGLTIDQIEGPLIGRRRRHRWHGTMVSIDDEAIDEEGESA